MGHMIRELCAFSIVSAVASSIAPESPVKTVMGMLSSVILMLVVLEPVSSLDLDGYAASLAVYHEMEQQLDMEAKNMSDRLNRLVIEEEYAAYIKDKALEYGVEMVDADIRLEWITDGFWMPVAVEIDYLSDSDGVERLKEHITIQLGLSEERQTWCLVQ